MKDVEKLIISKECPQCNQWTDCKKHITVEGNTVKIEVECLSCKQVFKEFSV